MGVVFSFKHHEVNSAETNSNDCILAGKSHSEGKEAVWVVWMWGGEES